MAKNSFKCIQNLDLEAQACGFECSCKMLMFL